MCWQIQESPKISLGFPYSSVTGSSNVRLENSWKFLFFINRILRYLICTLFYRKRPACSFRWVNSPENLSKYGSVRKLKSSGAFDVIITVNLKSSGAFDVISIVNLKRSGAFDVIITVNLKSSGAFDVISSVSKFKILSSL
jgi:hypothetical protein